MTKKLKTICSVILVSLIALSCSKPNAKELLLKGNEKAYWDLANGEGGVEFRENGQFTEYAYKSNGKRVKYLFSDVVELVEWNLSGDTLHYSNWSGIVSPESPDSIEVFLRGQDIKTWLVWSRDQDTPIKIIEDNIPFFGSPEKVQEDKEGHEGTSEEGRNGN